MGAAAIQVGLFDPPAAPVVEAPPAPVKAGLVLRPYQVEAVQRIDAEHVENRSTLLVMATGTGKTAVFSSVISRTVGRSLVLAHRDELITQAAHRLRQDTGRVVAVEKAEEYARPEAEVVVASVQSLTRETRLKRFTPEEFAMIVVDEAHHAVADSYRKILSYFTGKVLGVTATPDRQDRLAMGEIFDSVAFVYDIADAIKDGFLCPIRVCPVLVDSVDLDGVKVVAGDLNQGDLDEKMGGEKALHAVAKPCIELAEGRRTIVFTTGVATAHNLADVFNGYRADCAKAVDGEMDLDVRRQVLQEHQNGRYQFLINVGIATEGYDDPEISCIAMARPTKSRALYTQMAGRGTRIFPGKADLLVLDFTPNSGRHKLVCGLDILAGKYPDAVVDRAKKIAKQTPGMLAADALAQAENQIAEEARRALAAKRATVGFRVTTVNPFDLFDIPDAGNTWGDQFGSKPPTEKQRQYLESKKIPVPETKREASRLIGYLRTRQENNLCTYGQARVLAKKGYDTDRITFDEARQLMDAMAKNNWKRLTPEQDAAIFKTALQEPGWNG